MREHEDWQAMVLNKMFLKKTQKTTLRLPKKKKTMWSFVIRGLVAKTRTEKIKKELEGLS